MKFSIFNSTIKLSPKISLLYNSFTDKYILFSNAISIDEALLLKNSFSNKLQAGGFIISDSIDEVSAIKIINEQTVLNDRAYNLIINPTLDCNFRCWYCYETHSKDLVMDEITLEKTKLFINNKSRYVKTLNLSFFGGEPLLEYDRIIKPLIVFSQNICKINNVKLNISFTTNGFLLDNNMIPFFKNHNVSLFQITLDGGKINHNQTRISLKKDSYETIIENIKSLLNCGLGVVLRINSTKENIDSANDIITSFKDVSVEMKRHLRVCIQQVWQDKSDITEKKNILIEQFIKCGIDTSVNIYDNLRNPCYADLKNSAIINYNGDIYKCTAVDFISTNRDGFLDINGTIIQESDKLNIRLNAKLKQQSCLKCRILPLCAGGCSQNILNSSETDYCINNNSDYKKNEVILSRFRYNIYNNPEWDKL